VKVIAEGEDQALDAFVKSLREGPSLAHVNGVEIAWEAAKEDLPPFEIR
jgi:acylphosphatase